MKERLTSRKFLLAVLTVIGAMFLVFMGRISDGVFSTIIVAVIGAYFAANVTQKIKAGADVGVDPKAL